jgi:predicted CoA-binding protein
MAADLSNNPDAIRDLLQTSRVIALVGHSDRKDRDSYQIAQFLRRVGYTVYPVNPLIDSVDGHTSYARLQDIPESVDIVDVFRGRRHIPGIVEDAIAIGARAVWTQLGLEHEAAADLAIANGVDIIMNRCTKVEYMRLGVSR